ncbi:MAG: M16 family metallopeptidase [Anaerolineae bacterium]
MRLDWRLGQLPNGLRVGTIRRPKGPTVAVRIYLRAGSRYDDGLPGLAHLVEHLIFQGSETRSRETIYREIEGRGGLIDAGTSKEYSTFQVNLLQPDLEVGLEVLADAFTQPRFDHSALESERRIVLQEMGRTQDSEGTLLDRFAQTLWQRHPLRWPVLGDEASLARIRRKDLVSFHRKHYVARNMVLALCGAINHDQALEAVGRHFGHLDSGNEVQPDPAEEPPIREPRDATIRRETYQAYLIMGVRGVTMEDPRRFALRLMERVLGFGGDSRLHRRLRDRDGLAYAPQVLAPVFEDAGYFAVRVNHRPENGRVVRKAILEEWERLRDDLVSRGELERAQRAYEGSLARGLETNHRAAGLLGAEALLHRFEPPDERLEKARGESPESLRELARDLFLPEARVAVTLGPGTSREASPRG